MALNVGGANRKVLFSAGNSATVLVDGVGRSVLGTTTAPDVFISGVNRKTLVTFIPQHVNLIDIPIFPILPEGFPVKVNIITDTVIGTTKSLREMRVAQQTFPLWDIEILFEELLDQTQNQTPYAPFAGYQQYMQLVQNWLMMYGQTGVFAFNCPWDNSRSAQLIGIGDGSTYIFNVYRSWGTGANITSLPVGAINTVISVQINGVTIPTNEYRVERDQLIFINSGGTAVPPGTGLAITMTFTFYYLCRFLEDEQSYEEFAKNRWTVPSLKFRAVNWLTD